MTCRIIYHTTRRCYVNREGDLLSFLLEFEGAPSQELRIGKHIITNRMLTCIQNDNAVISLLSVSSIVPVPGSLSLSASHAAAAGNTYLTG
jgi:hypothetical protein